MIHAVSGGLLTKKDAMQRYSLTPCEYAEWEMHYKKHGINGLKVTRLQSLR